MELMRIEFCVPIPGPKGVDDPLEPIEKYLLGKEYPDLYEAILANKLHRLVDEKRNFFLAFLKTSEEEK